MDPYNSAGDVHTSVIDDRSTQYQTLTAQPSAAESLRRMFTNNPTTGGSKTPGTITPDERTTLLGEQGGSGDLEHGGTRAKSLHGKSPFFTVAYLERATHVE